MPPPGFTIRQLGTADVAELRGAVAVFAQAFGDAKSYGPGQTSEAYLRGLLAGDSFIAVVAEEAGRVVGTLAGYELRKCEQERSEIYIYDLAVLAEYRRRGLATAMIDCLKGVAVTRGAGVIYVQADYGDEPAIALYTKLGIREDVMHFDIPVRPAKDRNQHRG